MQASIKTKLLLMCILLVLVSTFSISIAYYVLAKQEKHRESQQRLQVAFNIVFDDVTRQMQLRAQQLNEQVQRDNTLLVAANFYLRKRQSTPYHVGVRSFLSSRLSRLGQLLSTDRLTLYAQDGTLVASYEHPGPMQSGIDMKLPLKHEIPHSTTSLLFREGETLGMRVLFPLFDKTDVLGAIAGDFFFTPRDIQRYTFLSKTDINFFAGERFMLGTLPEQTMLTPDILESEISCDAIVHAAQPPVPIAMHFAKDAYYQGRCVLRNDREAIGAISVSFLQEVEKQGIRNIMTAVLTIAGIASAISFLLVSKFIVPTFTRPIISLTQVTSEIARGNLQQSIHTTREDELGLLARSFAHMRDEIQKKIAELEQLNHGLERRVKERTAELVRQKYILDSFMATVPARIYFKDCEGRFTRANMAHAKKRGLNHPSEELGKTDFDFCSEEIASRQYAQEQEIIRSGQPIINQEVAGTSLLDGETNWSLATKMPLRDEHGAIIGIFGISHDITDLKRTEQELARYRDHLEELVEERTAELLRINDRLQEEIRERSRIEHALRLSEEQYRTLAENVMDGVVIVQDGALVFSNAVFAAMLGQTKESLLQKDPLSFFHSHSKPDAKARLYEESATFPDPRWQARLLPRGKRTLWSEIDQTSISWHGKTACLLTIRDVTERKLKEKRLEKERAQLQQENITLRSSVAERYKFGELIGKSAAMQQIYELIVSAAASEVNVLICGESGTGKELIARTIHQMSRRKDQAFVPVNCASIPETLFEREFFGHRKGAFTGADRDKPGLFDQAHQGTLFLDEVTELGPGMQAKLLRVLQDGVYTPLGSPKTKQADVVIVAATNKAWKPLIEQQRLRQDFFYRICVIEVQTPPLRKRKDDLPLLIEFFLERFRLKQERIHKAQSGDLPVEQTMLPSDVLQALYAYDWPGNVRELQNVIQRYLATKTLDRHIASSSSYEPLRADDTPLMPGSHNGMTLPDAINALEQQMISQALAQQHKHRENTAKQLGITRRALQYKLKKYKLLS